MSATVARDVRALRWPVLVVEKDPTEKRSRKGSKVTRTEKPTREVTVRAVVTGGTVELHFPGGAQEAFWLSNGAARRAAMRDWLIHEDDLAALKEAVQAATEEAERKADAEKKRKAARS